MLPGSGLFRNISCPFYDEDDCTRPFCHFNHALKKSENNYSKICEILLKINPF